MRVFTPLVFFLLFFSFWSCTNIEDATSSKRRSFIRLYEGPESYSSSDIIEVSDGYILLGGMTITDDSVLTVVIKTDKFGNIIEGPKYHPGGAGKSIVPFTRAGFNGYLIIGDRIKVDPTKELAGNIEISSTRLLCIDENLDMAGSSTIKDNRNPNNVVLTDFTGSAITVTEDNRVIILGTYKPAGETQRPMLLALNESFTIDVNPDSIYKRIEPSEMDWIDFYTIIDKDYINAKSIHYSAGEITWASSILEQTGSIADTYVAVPTIEEPLTYVNFSLLGDNLPVEKQFTVKDIQRSKIQGLGYGIVGTFAQTDGSKKNMFFAQVDQTGTILSSDTLFVDGFSGIVTSNVSLIDDTGETITGTFDGGYVLAGTLTTRSVEGTTIGKGERDILLIKVNAGGDVVWSKLIGGAGDEVVSRIREASDRSLLITGTNTIGGYSSIFLIRTNDKGELIK